MNSVLPLLLLFLAAEPVEISGRVTSIHDGDTFRLISAGVETKIRPAKIDCPELNQPGGKEAREALVSLIAGRDVTFVWNGKSHLGRKLGVIWVDGRNVNEEMCASGFAWYDHRYGRDKRLMWAMMDARESERGLWANDAAIEPWKWRKEKHVR